MTVNDPFDVDLHSRDGSALVATVKVPVFTEPPAVISWGIRVFLRQEDDSYRECFHYAAPPKIVDGEGGIGS
jgi:hypothetical protein